LAVTGVGWGDDVGVTLVLVVYRERRRVVHFDVDQLMGVGAETGKGRDGGDTRPRGIGTLADDGDD
jgi:hypothetical protein